MIDLELIKQELKDCIDPELRISIVDLGFIYGVIDNNGDIQITITLTTPGCPLINVLLDEIKQKISRLPGVKSVDVNITFDPPWSPDLMSESAKLQLGL